MTSDPRRDLVGHARHGRSRRLGTPASRPALLTVLTAIVSALVLLSAGVSYAAYSHLNGNITAQDINRLLKNRAPKVATTKPGDKYTAENILLLGSDTRQGADQKYGKSVQGGRSDTAIVLHLSADRKRAIAMSIPRDSWVHLPECLLPDGRTVPAQVSRFNAAYAYGGAACTAQAVESLTGISIDHYVVIDFSGFVKMVNALGGVWVCTPQPINDKKSMLTLPAGRTLVMGDQALGFVRVRHIGDGSDLARIKRQQAFLSSMAQEAMSTKLLLNPNKLYSFLDAATKSVVTDPGLGSLQKMQDLASSLSGIKLSDIQFITVPNHPYPPNPNVVEWDTGAAQQLFDALRYDQPLPGSENTPKPTLPVAPAQITVDVYNASGTPGQARQAADALHAQGMKIGTIATWSGPEQNTTEILVGPGVPPDNATALSMFVPGALRTDDATRGSHLVLVIGRDFTSVRTLVTPSGSPTPTPTLQARSANQDICS